MIIRVAEFDDASRLPAIERSADEVFRTTSDLAWIADDDVMSEDEHRQRISLGVPSSSTPSL